MLIAALLGLLQGIAEWLPVSSEGVVTAAYSAVKGGSLDDAIGYALWLHVGTALSVLVVFRREIFGVVGTAISSPRHPTPLVKFLFFATVSSAVVGFPLLLTLGELSERIGAVAMVLVGVMMLVTGWLQLRSPTLGSRGRDDTSVWDALLAGVAQGFAVLPGLSRSGLTVSLLLARQIERREALVLSFLMSVPASLGAGLYASLDGGLIGSNEAMVSVVVSAVVGLITIKALLAVAQRINFAKFVIGVGLFVIAGALWEALR